MSDTLFPRAAFLQFHISLGNPESNLKKLHEGISRLAPEQDTIVVLPELWTTGFDYPRIAELADNTPTLLDSLHNLARRHTIYLAGSLPERSDNNQETFIYNTLFLTGPEGILGSYRKNKLFSLWKEDSFFKAGTVPQTIQTAFGNIGTLICFDIRFPSLAGIQAAAGVRLLVISSQWPAARINHWRILLQARAIENQLYVAACNSCGQTGNFLLGGHSMIIAPDGTILSEAGEDEETGKTELNEELLNEIRAKFRTVEEG